MGKSTKQEAKAARFCQDIRWLLRTRVREAIDITLEEEFTEALTRGLVDSLYRSRHIPELNFAVVETVNFLRLSIDRVLAKDN